MQLKNQHVEYPCQFSGCISEKDSLDDSSKDVALLFHEDILVDGDRCTVLLRMSGTSQLLTPAEVQRSIKKKLPKFGMASLPSYPYFLGGTSKIL